MTSNVYYASQNRMNEAIETIIKFFFKNIVNCVRFYGVNRNIFSRRLHEKSFRSIRIAFNKHFIDTEEPFMMTYIQYYDEKNLSIISKLLTEAANFLIHARNFSTKSDENF